MSKRKRAEKKMAENEDILYWLLEICFMKKMNECFGRIFTLSIYDRTIIIISLSYPVC